MTDESKQPTEGSLPPETESPRRPRRGGRGDDTPKEAPSTTDGAEAKEIPQIPEPAPVSKDTKPARRMRFRLVRR
jgi:hypothetical protein